MGRQGIFKEDVIKARDRLMAMGKNPSIDAIRIELGNTGSKATIHRYLKELEAESGEKKGPRLAVSDAIQELAARLGERLHQEAGKRIAEITESHAQELAEHKKRQASLLEEHQLLQKQSERQIQQLATEKSAHKTSLAELQEQKIANAKLVQQIQGLKEQLIREENYRQSLEAKLHQADQSLERLRQEYQEERQEERQRFQQALNLAHQEKEDALTAQRSVERELQEKGEALIQVRLQAQQNQMETEKLQAQIEMLMPIKEELAASRERLLHMDAQQKMAEKKWADLSETLETQNANLNASRQQQQQIEAELQAARAVVAAQAQTLALFASPPLAAAAPAEKSTPRANKKKPGQ